MSEEKPAMTGLVLATETYRLWRTDREDWPYWLQNNDDEGMAMSEVDVDDMFGQYFTENF